MCVEVKKRCECGQQEVQFHFRDNIMDPEVIDRLYCPTCSADVAVDQRAMVADNGWLIKYDMTMAAMFAITKLDMAGSSATPDFLFDHGYATWLEMYPGEKQDVKAERQEIIARKDDDPMAYLREINDWAVARVERLKEMGWRKAQLA
ncbi:MAG: hypothetical protein ABFR97_08320 [Thermodesulfobacteriota bacterium]